MPDLRTRRHGLNIVTFEPVTERGRDWLDALNTEPWQWMGGTLGVDTRCAGDLIYAALEDGLEVA